MFFSAGAIIAANAGIPSIVGIAVCWLALFSPGILMIYAVLPFWGTLRSFAAYRRYGCSTIGRCGLSQPLGSTRCDFLLCCANCWH